jgi:hypothetical protein
MNGSDDFMYVVKIMIKFISTYQLNILGQMVMSSNFDFVILSISIKYSTYWALSIKMGV